MYEFTCRSEVFSFAWRYSYDIDRISRIFSCSIDIGRTMLAKASAL